MRVQPKAIVPVLATLALAGCGASSTAHDPTWQELQAQSRALLRKSEAAERAEGKNPAETRARAEVKERREADESARLQQAEASRAAEAQERQARQTAAEIHAHELARENAPDSHHYPSAVRAGFLRECESTSGHEDAACECAIKRIEAKVPLGRYRQNEAEVREGHPLPIIYSIEYGYCVGSEAVSE